MSSLLQDVRLGVRLLRRQPGFTAAALLVLTLGIGANAAMFGLVNQLLFEARPGGLDAQLVGVFNRDAAKPDEYDAFSYDEFARVRGRRDVFQSVSAHGFGLVGVTEGALTRRVFADIITADYFETFGVAPARGRAFTSDEERPGAEIPVAILSHSAWQRRGGGDDVVGQQITINTRAFTIVGIAPPKFGGSMVVAAPELFVPTGVYDSLSFDVLSDGRPERLADPQVRGLVVVGRLRAEVARPAAETALQSVLSGSAAAAPDERPTIQLTALSRLGVSTSPLPDTPLVAVTALLLSCAAIVLVVASFNLANMLLARGRARQQEFAIRLAIGGSRGRIVRQLITENLVLTLAGGATGLLAAWWGLRLLTTMLPAALPIEISLMPSIDGRVLAVTLLCCIIGALISGVVPALRAARSGVPMHVRTAGEAPARRRWLGLSTRDLLVTGQLTLTLTLLSSAGLFLRGAIEAARSDPGFTLDRGIVVNADGSLAAYSPERTRALYRQLQDRLRAIPGVEDASFASLMPFGEFLDSRDVQRAGAPIASDDPRASTDLVSATTTSVGAGYFASLGLPILLGRDFTDAEAFAVDGERLAIIDRPLAEQLFGSASPIDQIVQFSEDATAPTTLRVVGVVAGVRDSIADTVPVPHLYTTFGQDFRANVHFHLRTSDRIVDEPSLLPSVRQAIREVDAQLPLVTLETRPMFRDRNLMIWMVRAGAGLTGALALAALIVAMVGVYGVKAYLVARRTREIGVRIALGATPRQVLGLVMRDGLAIVAIGLTIGLGVSVAAGQAMRSVLYQGRAFDVPVVAFAATALVAAAALATWIPALRAIRISPTRALRDN